MERKNTQLMNFSTKIVYLVSLLLTLVICFPAVEAHGEEDKQIIVVYENKEGEEAVRESDAAIDEVYDNVPAAAVTADAETVRDLKKDPDIKYVEPDTKIYSTGSSTAAASSVQASSQILNQWNLAPIQASWAWRESITGKGVKIAVIDSGIYPHRDLKIAGGYAAVNYTTSYEDDAGHGTHVAGIIGAKHNQYGTDGVAPDAGMYAVKVLDRTGTGNMSDLLEGIDWAISNRMDIINLSIGTTYKSKALQHAVESAYQDGVLLVASSGNEGVGHPINYPAAFEDVIAVSASDSRNNIASFSVVGDKLEVAAPGSDIYSTYLGANYAMMSGTSQAAPHVSAMLALLKQQYPEETNDQLRLRMQGYSKDLGEEGRDPLFGYGLVQYQSDQTVHYHQALEAVQLTETTQTQENYDKAQHVVKGLSNSAEKQNLQKRLDKVKQIIILQEAKNKVSKAEKSKQNRDITAAQTMANKVTNSTEKKHLQKRLDKVRQAVALEAVQDKVAKAERSQNKSDIDTAQTAINKVTNSTEKKNLQYRLDKIKQALLVKEAKDKVGQSEKRKTKKNVDTAQKAIHAVAKGKDRTNLQIRLNKVKQSQLHAANASVKAAERSPSDKNLKKAQSAINELQAGKDKDSLQKRLEKLKKKLSEAKKLSDATYKVKKAEKDRTKKARQAAQSAVNKVSSSKDKKTLQNRINKIKVRR
jgi:minor extracellular protease Epr